MKNTILILPLIVLLSTSGTAQEEEAESRWAALDRELQALEILEMESTPGPHIWGYLRTNFAASDEPVHHSDPGEYRAFALDNLRVNVSGELDSYSYHISADAFTGTPSIEDAWGRVALGDQFAFSLGRFKTPFLRSGLVEARDLLFIARTRNGTFYSMRDMGTMLTGDHGRMHWVAAVQNGADGKAERFLTTLHASINIIGEAELPWEGAYHAGSLTRLTLGAGISNDDAHGASGEGTAISAEAYLLHKRFSLTAEWLDYESAYSLFPSELEPRGDTRPWTITGSYMIVPEKYELALRYDNYDEKGSSLDYGREKWTIGVNRYISGHDLKWQLNYADIVKGGDGDGPHEKWIALGLTLAF
jgi:hypothetical protein